MQTITIPGKKRAASRDRNYWEEIVKIFASSNESAKDFCSRRDINLGTLSHWRGVFKKEKATLGHQFIEMKVVSPHKTSSNFTIECPSGHKIVLENIALEEAKSIFKLLGLISC